MPEEIEMHFFGVGDLPKGEGPFLKGRSQHSRPLSAQSTAEAGAR